MRTRAAFVLLAVIAMTSAACGGDGGESSDLLARVQDDGVIRVSTDPAYPPQSSLNEETGEYEGFDIDVANEVAERLGVTVEWQTPAWELITAGGWNGRWDMSVGSMTITPERAEVLHFTPPYYYTPAAIAVHTDNSSINGAADLSGLKIGVCGGCTYDSYLQGTLEIAQDESGEPVAVESAVQDPEIVTYDTDSTALQDLSLGDGTRVDAAISALPTIQAAIDAGSPLKIVGEPLYFEPLSVALDRRSDLDPTSLVTRVSQIIQEMHEDGTLAELSMQWYGVDLTVTS